jgi:hypothetical protein
MGLIASYFSAWFGDEAAVLVLAVAGLMTSMLISEFGFVDLVLSCAS